MLMLICTVLVVFITTAVLLLITSGRKAEMVTVDESNEEDRGEVSEKLDKKVEKIDEWFDKKISDNPGT